MKIILTFIIFLAIFTLIGSFRYRHVFLINKQEKNFSQSCMTGLKNYCLKMEDENGNIFFMNANFRVIKPLVEKNGVVLYKEGDIIHPDYYNELIITNNNTLNKKYNTITRKFFVAKDVSSDFIYFLVKNKLLPLEYVKYQYNNLVELINL